jgi:alpha-galactosidase
MSQVKVAVLGAGSFVFGPSLLKDAIAEHRLDDLELAMVDPNDLALELMASVGRRMAHELGVGLKISSHARRTSALDGADFVICAAAQGMLRRFETDCAIIDRLSPGHMISRFGGIAGISYSLRQIALIQEICSDMRRICPNAWLLNLANPLPHISQAAHEEGVRTVGFCSVALAGYGKIWNILHQQQLDYPFEPAQSQLDVTMGGLNHFSWVLAVRDHETEEDLYPAIRESAAHNDTLHEPITQRMLAETGYLLAPGDDHVREFLAPYDPVAPRCTPGLGTLEQREQQIDLLRDVAEGRAPWQDLFDHESWEEPIDLIAAMIRGQAKRFHALNLINRGQLPGLPASAFVETPAIGTTAGPIAEKVQLPAAVSPLCEHTALVTDTIVRAARQQNRRLLHEAIEMDPTILDKPAAIVALDACLEAHADILPAYR